MKRIFPCLVAVIAITTIFPLQSMAERLIASGVTSGDRFGAAISISGTCAFIGAPLNDAIGTDAGGVQVFTRQTTTSTSAWRFSSSLVPYAPGNHAHFGASVSAQGASVAVGAPGANEVGAVFVFQNSGMWNQEGKLMASDGAVGDEFGHAVALYGDVLVVGAPRHASGTGAVYVFERRSGIWTQTAKLTPQASGTSFGWSVALEGNVAVIGAIHDRDDGASAGAVHVFVKTNGTWSSTFKMKPYEGQAGAFFGFSVDIDNGVIAVGAPARDYNGLVNSGSVHVFEPSGTNQWIEIHQLTGGTKANDHFGRSVSLTSSWLAAGVDGKDDPDNGGAVYLYHLDGQIWTIRNTLTQNDRAGKNDRLGWPVSLCQDGNYYWLLAGASSSSSEGENAGAAYAFTNYTNNAPSILAQPTRLTLQNLRMVPGASAPSSSTRDDSGGGFATGLVVPESVRQFWMGNSTPPQMPSTTARSYDVYKDWSSYDSPIRYQGNCGSCAIFAAVALMENWMNRLGISMDGGVDLAEQFPISTSPLFSCIGSWYWDVFKFISENGIPSESCCPYLGQDINCVNGCSTPEQFVKPTEYSGVNGLWGTTYTADNMREALQEGPLCVAMLTPADFSSYTGGILVYNGPTLTWIANSASAHAVLLVGYDDNRQCFKAKNSWGANWGDKGYFYIRYDDIHKLMFGSYACKISGVYLEGIKGSLVLWNQGNAVLNVTSLSPEKNWLTLSPSSPFSIQPGNYQTIMVEIPNWSALAIPTDSNRIIIRSNDAFNATMSVPVDTRIVSLGSFGEVLKGDINGLLTDGRATVDLADAIIALRVLTGFGSTGVRADYQLNAADIDANGDARVGLPEAIYILSTVAAGTN